MCPMHVEGGKNYAILSFSKHFLTGTVFQRCMQDLVSNKIVIAFTAKKIFSLCKFKGVVFCYT